MSETTGPDREFNAAVRILAGLVANPSIIAHRPDCGWGLVNCTSLQLADYALHLAQELERAQLEQDTARAAISKAKGPTHDQ
jgi:hypothetical protein